MNARPILIHDYTPTFKLYSLISAILLLAVLLLQAGRVHADTQPGSDNDQNYLSEGMDITDKHKHIADELKLTDSQRVAFDNARKQMFNTVHSGHELHKQIREAIESDNYDETKVKELVHKHNIEMEKNIVIGSKAMHEFYTSLAPEQKTQFTNMHEKMGSNSKHHWKEQKDSKSD